MNTPTRRSAIAIATAGAIGAATLHPRKKAPVFSPLRVTAVSGEWRKLVSAGQGPCNLQNRDPFTTVYIGSEGTDPAGNTVGIIDPLGSQPVDGQQEIWCITLAGTATVIVLPGGGTPQVSPALIQQQLQANISTLQLAGATPGGPKTGSNPKAIRVWAVYVDVEISTDGTYTPAVNNIQAQLSSGSSVLHQLDAKIFPASSVVNLGNSIPFPQSFPVPASQTFTLSFLNAAIAGVTQSANALIFFSSP